MTVLDIVAIGAFLLGHYWWWRAMRQLSPVGQDRFWRILLWSTMFAGSEDFTTTGWRHYVRARWAFLACLICFVLVGIVHLRT